MADLTNRTRRRLLRCVRRLARAEGRFRDRRSDQQAAAWSSAARETREDCEACMREFADGAGKWTAPGLEAARHVLLAATEVARDWATGCGREGFWEHLRLAKRILGGKPET